MNNAALYHNSNFLQKHDTFQLLDESMSKMSWKIYSPAVVMDVGSGDGSTTAEILEPFLPANYSRLIGCDSNEDMVDFANENYGNDRINFVVLDIKEDLPPKYIEVFDHVFSFYVLNWIIEQNAAFKNVYDILSNGGECFMIFMAHSPIYNIYRKLALMEKWRPWLINVESHISPYHDSMDPDVEVTKILTDIGFKDVYVKNLKRSFVFESLQNLEDAAIAVNPFEIPTDLFNDYVTDYMQLILDSQIDNMVVNYYNDSVSVTMNYTILVVYGSK